MPSPCRPTHITGQSRSSKIIVGHRIKNTPCRTPELRRWMWRQIRLKFQQPKHGRQWLHDWFRWLIRNVCHPGWCKSCMCQVRDCWQTVLIEGGFKHLVWSVVVCWHWFEEVDMIWSQGPNRALIIVLNGIPTRPVCKLQVQDTLWCGHLAACCCLSNPDLPYRTICDSAALRVDLNWVWSSEALSWDS